MNVFKIYYNDTLLGSSLSEPNAMYYNAVMTEQANAAGKLTFTLPCKHHELLTPQLLKGNIRVLLGEVERWRGRVVQIDVDYYGNRTFTCEGALAYFSDIWYCCEGKETPEWTDDTISIGDLIRVYNLQASSYRYLEVGKIGNVHAIDEVCEAEHWIYCKSILQRFLAEVGGYMWMVGPYFNWVTTLGKCTQACRLGWNMAGCTAKMDASRVYTEQWAKYTHTENGGEPIPGHVVSRANKLVYGTINGDKVVDLGDVGDYHATDDGREDAYNAAEAKLTALNLPGERGSADLTITATVFDRSILGEGDEPFSLGKMVEAIIPTMGIREWMEVKEIKTDLNRPEQSRITLGSSRKVLTNRLEERYG